MAPARRSHRARAPARRARSRDREAGIVRINIPGQEVLRLKVSNERSLQHHALSWTYALRNRERWHTQVRVAAEQRGEIVKLAEEIGFQSEHFERMAQARLVEVEIP